MKVAIVGAGIAGLCSALRLKERHEVVVFERQGHPGGKIRSQWIDGFLFEWGPNSFPSNAEPLRSVVKEACLEGEILEASPAASHRYIYWGGALHALPSKPPGLLTFSLLSPQGKIRALGEVFVRAPREPRAEESVNDFFQRRFGREVAERIVAPALLGVSGGSSKSTDVHAMFPILPDLESKYGSVIRGVIRRRAKPNRLLSFRAEGMQKLTGTLAAMQGERLRLDCEVRSVEPRANGWRLTYGDGFYDADAVLLCTPSYRSADLVESWDGHLATLLRRIQFAPMRVAGVAFRVSDLPTRLNGFGFLVARGAAVRILGALYTSAIFPEQSPKDTAYLRVFLGGATDPQALELSTEDARAIIMADLATILGIEGTPVAYHEILWHRAIPQYALGHRALLAEIEERVAPHAGLVLGGNSYRGIGLAETVAQAFAAADRVDR